MKAIKPHDANWNPWYGLQKVQCRMCELSDVSATDFAV